MAYAVGYACPSACRFWDPYRGAENGDIVARGSRGEGKSDFREIWLRDLTLAATCPYCVRTSAAEEPRFSFCANGSMGQGAHEPQKGCPAIGNLFRVEGGGKRTIEMFAVIKTGGKQYTVAANDVITIERLEGEAGDVVAFSEVLMIGGEKAVIGSPLVAGATVAGELVEQARGPKVISFKKRRRQNSKRKKGHRQHLSLVRITEILTDGKKPSGIKAAKPAAVKSDETKSAAAGVAVAAVGGGQDQSNLSLIAGIGPTIEKKLRAAGIATWSEIAAWGEVDIAKWDEELKLRGRATREEWVEQAKELLAGKPPRAKADQAELASGEDR
jgi:large subunit ribosomal protein L21